MPSSNSSEVWRAENEAINKEMERLILSSWPRSTEERDPEDPVCSADRAKK